MRQGVMAILLNSLALLGGACLLICGIAAMLTAIDESSNDDDE